MDPGERQGRQRFRFALIIREPWGHAWCAEDERLRLFASLAIAVIFAGADTRAQVTASAPQGTPAVTTEAPEESQWSFYASAYSYIVPDGGSYGQPTFTADRDRLHLEARYNYEALDTGSVWVGCNFGGGERLAWEITPMLAGVFGATTGVAPGYKGALSWWKLQFSSEGEQLFDTGESSDSFSYTWSEAALAPVEWFRFGLAIQQTYAHETDSGSQSGPFVGLYYKNADVTAYVFNPRDENPTFVIAGGLRF